MDATCNVIGLQKLLPFFGSTDVTYHEEEASYFTVAYQPAAVCVARCVGRICLLLVRVLILLAPRLQGAFHDLLHDPVTPDLVDRGQGQSRKDQEERFCVSKLSCITKLAPSLSLFVMHALAASVGSG